MAALPKTLPACLTANIINEQICEPKLHQNGADLPFQDGPIYQARVLSISTLNQEYKDVRPAYEISLEFGDDQKPSVPFEPGTALGIICPNVAEDVERILKLLHLTGNEMVEIMAMEDAKAQARFKRSFSFVPEKCSTRYLFENVLDLRTVLKKAFVKLLGDACPEGSSERTELHDMSSSNADEYRKYILEGRAFLMDVLARYPSCKPSLAVLIENLARLSPRFYSTANYDFNNRSLKIAYKPMEFESQGKTLLGQCSTMFLNMQRVLGKSLPNDGVSTVSSLVQDLSIGDGNTVGTTLNIKCYKRKNIRKFAFPVSANIPFAFICHGTGIAPFMAYLDWLELQKQEARCKKIYLFYGVRYFDRDYLYRDRLLKAEKDGLIRIIMRQSRANPEKGYIQEGVLQHKEIILELLNGDGQVLICGDYKTMATDTQNVIKEILVGDRQDEKLAADEFSALIKDNRIQLDVWT